MDSVDVSRLLRAACAKAGGQKAWATANSVSPAYVCDVLHARTEAGDAILSALGLRKVVRYVEIRTGEGAAA